MRKILVRLVFSLVIAAALVLWLSNQGFEVLPSLAAIRSVASWTGIAAYAALFSAFHVLRAWRWIYLLRPFAAVSSRVMMEVAFAGFAAIQMMPLRTGEVARPYLLDRYTGISKSALFGTIAIERVIDGLLISLWLSAALIAVPADHTPYVSGLKVIPLLIFVIALSLLIAFYKWPTRVKSVFERTLGRVSPRLNLFSLGVLDRFHAGLAALPNLRNLFAFVGLSVLYWGINSVGFFVLARSVGLNVPVVAGVVGMACLAVGILLPAGPGYFGNFQVAVLAALEIYIQEPSASASAAVFIFLLYVLQTGLTVVYAGIGAVGLVRRPALRAVASSASK